MFNPASFSQQYEILYTKNAGYGATNQQVDYQRSKPGALNLLLTVDGTGVSEIGLAALLGQKTVTERVKQFLDLTFRVNGKIHEPNFLTVEWGTLVFACRLGKVEITYTTFDRDGSPLRAQLNATFLGDQEVKKQMSMDSLSSPDLTHWVTVAEGDTLPVLAQRIYGSADNYLTVAEANGLDNFRALEPGMELAFPPLDTSSTPPPANGVNS
jgi:nucleoid-associated protein YgaU